MFMGVYWENPIDQGLSNDSFESVQALQERLIRQQASSNFFDMRDARDANLVAERAMKGPDLDTFDVPFDLFG